MVGILRTMDREMQNKWGLGVKAACLAYNTMVHITGQTPFFATFGREAIVPIHWVYPIPKLDAEKDVSAWTETIKERFHCLCWDERETTTDCEEECPILQAHP